MERIPPKLDGEDHISEIEEVTLHVGSEEDAETVELLNCFLNMFTATNDVEYLNNVIGLAETLALAMVENLPALNQFMEMKETFTQPADAIDNGVGVINDSASDPIATGDEGITESDTMQDVQYDTPTPEFAGPYTSSIDTMATESTEDLKQKPESGLELKRLDEEISLAEESISDDLRPTNLDLATGLWKLASLVDRRYELTGDVEDLEKAILLGNKAVIATPGKDHAQALRLANLGVWYFNMYGLRGQPEDLDQAIQNIEQAASELRVDDPKRAAILANLGAILNSRYERYQEPEDMEHALEWTKEAIAATASDDPERASRLNNLSALLADRYETGGDIEDLEAAIKLIEEAVAVVTPDDPNRAAMLSNLGMRIMDRYDRFGEVKDLNQAIDFLEKATSGTPPHNTRRAGMLNNLSIVISRKYERFGSVDDIDHAIGLAKEAVAASPPSNPETAAWIGNVGARYTSKYQQLGAAEDLEQAIKYTEEAIEATDLDDPNMVALLGNLGANYSAKYRLFGAAEDIERSIRLEEEAVARAAPNHLNRPSWMANLGVSFAMKYKRFGAPEDLQQAIEWTQRALAVTPADNQDRTRAVANLGAYYWHRYGQFGGEGDISQAISWTREATETIPEDHPDRIGYAINLSVMYSNRYDRFNGLEDLEKAVHWAELAAISCPSDSQKRVVALVNLGDRLVNRFRQSGDEEDLERAIRLVKEAVSATPDQHVDKLTEMRNLGVMLHLRYTKSGAEEDLVEAFRCMEATAAETPGDHPDRGPVLYNLSVMIQSRYEHTNTTQDFNYLLRTCYEVWHSRVTPPKDRIRAARRAALALASRKMWQESSSLLQDALRMMPKLSPLSLGRADQEYHISSFASLIADTTSISMQAGEEATNCLRLLEFSRGIIAGLIIDSRREIEPPSAEYSELFAKLKSLRSQLDCPLPRIQTDPVGSELECPDVQSYRHREQMTNELEGILGSIREIPGYEGFQLPPRLTDILPVAGDGPIVIFNSTELRSDAIIVTKSSITALPLRTLFYSSVETRIDEMDQLIHGRRGTYHWRNKRMNEMLLWLWDTAVEPVLDALKFNAQSTPEIPNIPGSVTSAYDLPRIWWIGVGILARAPFHAAGDHSPGSTRNAISQVISSYIPTIKALSFARQRRLDFLSKESPRLLLVAMPTTPGKRPLANATREVEEITGLVGKKASVTQMDHPSAMQTLTALPSHDVVHFACHGVPDEAAPSNSCLLLRHQDGTLDRLTVDTLSSTRIERAQIAFLSACSTAENSAVALADESIYIASAFQLAGFSHVLATQWVANDVACREVAREFYRLLFSRQPTQVQHQDGHWWVSYSFHQAVRKLRDSIWREPLKWVPFIHTGA